jgi:predicted permease
LTGILLITAPIFLLVALGYATVRVELIPAAWLPALGGFVIRLALPALIFRSLTQRPLAEVMNLRYLLAYALGSLAVLAGTVLWARYLRREPLERAAIIGMGSACSNSAFIGYPIALQVVGPIAGTALALCAIVENVLILPVCLALADAASATHEPFHHAIGRAFAGLRSNPLVVAIATGMLCSALHLALPPPIARAVELLAAASAPVALFVVGGNLVGLPLRDMFLDVYAVSFSKLVLHPLAVAAGLLLCVPADPALRVAAVVIASAPMLSIYPIFGARHGMQGFCAATLLIATLSSSVTTSLTIWLLRSGLAVP